MKNNIKCLKVFSTKNIFYKIFLPEKQNISFVKVDTFNLFFLI